MTLSPAMANRQVLPYRGSSSVLTALVVLVMGAQVAAPPEAAIVVEGAAAVLGVVLALRPTDGNLGRMALLVLTTLVFTGPSGAASWLASPPTTTWLLPVFVATAGAGFLHAARESRDRDVLYVLVGLALLATVAAIRGYLDGTNGWSAPLRTVSVLAAWLWGRAAAQGRTESGDPVAVRVATAAGLVLALSPWVFGHVRFLAIGLASASLTARLSSMPIRSRMIGLVGLLFAVRSGTDLGIALAGMGLMAWDRVFRDRRVPVGAAVLASASVLAVPLVANDPSFGRVEASIQLPSGASVGDKLFADRGPIWRAAMEKIQADGFGIPAAGSPLNVEGVWLPWTGGAHNAFLQMGVELGLIGLLLTTVFYGIILSRGVTAKYGLRGTGDAVLLWGAIATLLVGSTFGQFPIQESGWFIWAVIGYVTPVHRQRSARRALSHQADC